MLILELNKITFLLLSVFLQSRSLQEPQFYNKHNNTSSPRENTTGVHYFKPPFVDDFSTITCNKLKHSLNVFCKDADIKIVFSSFKIKNFFSFKDPIPDALKSLVVYQFTCEGCNSRYIGETSRHFATRVKQHLSTDKNSHVYKHLNPLLPESDL